MVILLVIGVMDLRAMVVVAAAITIERLAPAGDRIARTIGILVVGAGSFLIARAAGLIETLRLLTPEKFGTAIATQESARSNSALSTRTMSALLVVAT